MKNIFKVLLFPIVLLAVPSNDYVITVKTDNVGISSDMEFKIPIYNTNGNGYNVDCDDDGTDEVTGATANMHQGGYTCVYISAGTYTIRVKDNNGDNEGFRRIRFYIDSPTITDVLKILSIEQWGTALWSSMAQAYRGASNLRVNALDVPNLSGFTSMRQMFQGCTEVNPNVSDWNVSTMTNLSSMFRAASSADVNVSMWNTSNVSNFSRMFQGATSANPDVSAWKLSSATSLSGMFRGATSANPDIRLWDTSQVTRINNMFNGSSVFNRSLGDWNISSLTSANHVFRNTSISVANYDDTLISWAQQSVQGSVTFSSDARYCQGASVRDTLISTSTWSIPDGGIECVPCGDRLLTLAHMQWKIISLPCQTGSNDIESLLGASLGVYGTDWVMYRQSGAGQYEVNATDRNTNQVRMQSTDIVVPGKGYWIIANLTGVGTEMNVTIPNTLLGLNFTSTVSKTSVSITDSDFRNVHQYALPSNHVSNAATVESKNYMAGNPFPFAFHISNLYFKNNDGLAVFRELGDASNMNRINATVYKHDSGGTGSVIGYEAVNSATPGFGGSIQAMEGFFIKLNKNQSNTQVNHFAYPLVTD